MQTLASEADTGKSDPWTCPDCGEVFDRAWQSFRCPHKRLHEPRDLVSFRGSPPRDRNEGTIQSEDFTVLSLADLNAQDLTDTPWLIDGVLPTNGVGSMVGRPKVGKSTLLRNLAACIVRGEPWLDRECLQGAVLYVTFEDDELTVREHMTALELVDGDSFYFVGRPSMPDKIVPLRKAITDFEPVLTIIDPLALFLGIRDGNDYHHVYQAMSAIMGVARDTNTAVLLSHHERKSGGEHGSEALGSTAFFGAVDCQLHIERDNEDGRTIKSEQRRGDPFDKTALVFDRDRGTLDLGLAVAEMRDRHLQDEVLAYINAAPVAVKVSEIRKDVKGKAEAIGRAIDRLLEDGAIQSDQQGRARFLLPS